LLSDNPEFLHQLRVGLRRLRSALRAFREVLARKSVRRTIRTLRKFSPRLGAARDWDVLVARMETGAVLPDLLRKAYARRDAARRVARRTLISKSFAAMPSEVRALALAHDNRSLPQFGAAALARAHARLMREARGADWSDSAERHAIRIRVKRLRYTCEFFAPAFTSRRAAAYLTALKALQDILGELNDIAVGRRLIGYRGDESALLKRLAPAWRELERRPVFWRAPA